jgi:hypothetical protein
MDGNRCRQAKVLWQSLLAATVFWGLAATATAWGHELGPFQVYGTFLRSGAFRLELKVDDEHLGSAQLGGPARPTRYGRIAGLSGQVEQRFGRFLSDLADSLTVSFDGIPASPTLVMDPDSGGGAGGAPARATLHVEGWIPGGARVFTIASSLPVKSYPVVLHSEDDESSSWRWVAGGATSPAYELAPRVVPPPPATVARRSFAPGFAHVLPHGPVPLLLVAAIFLLARRPRSALLMLAALAVGQGLGLVLALRGAAPLRPTSFEILLPLAVACLAVTGLVARPARFRPRSAPPGISPSWGRLLAPFSPSSAGRVVSLATTVALLAIGTLCGLYLAPAFPDGLAPPATLAATAPLAPPLTPPLLPAAAGGFALGAAAAELAVMAAAFVLIGLPFGDKAWYRGRVVVPACCLIALVSLYWSLSGLLS